MIDLGFGRTTVTPRFALGKGERQLAARNLLGEAAYRELLADIDVETPGEKPNRVADRHTPYRQSNRQSTLFE